MTKRHAAAATFLVIVMFLAGCGGSEDKASTGSEIQLQRDADQGRLGAPPDQSVSGAGSSSSSKGAADIAAVPPQAQIAPRDPVPAAPGPNSKVIKNARLEIEVAEGRFQTQFDRATQLAEEFGGFVSNSSVSETKGEIASGTVSLRIPADRFQTAISRLKKLGKVTAEDQNGQDVTREYVDLEARLRHAKAQEAFFLRLLDESKTIADLVQVQQQLSNVQLQIEEIQGQLQYLKDQTAFSTVTVRVFEPGAAAGPKPKGLARAWTEAVNAFLSVIAGLIVFLGWIAPFTLLVLILFGLWKLVRSKTRPDPVP